VAMPQANKSALIRKGDVFRRQLERPADDQRHGNRAGIHHQHMLQAERQQARRRQDLVDRMDFGGCGHGLPPGCGPSGPAQADTRRVPEACPPKTLSPRSCPVARTLLNIGSERATGVPKNQRLNWRSDVALIKNRYGKGRVRVMRIHRTAIVTKSASSVSRR
jgi:hypothetical protein